MTQTKLSSFYEALMNTLIGYVVSLGLQLIIYPAYGAVFTFGQNIQIGIWFLLASLIRGFIIRRWFNAMLHRAANKLAGA